MKKYNMNCRPENTAEFLPKIISAFLAVLFSLYSYPDVILHAAFGDNLSCESGIVIEAGSGKTVFEKNADAVMPMASTTKIMTVLTVIENYCSKDMNKEFPVSEKAVGIEGSSIYLKAGEKISMENLLYAVMLESANDAAAAAAAETGGTIENFVDMMNEKASDMGLLFTHFTNPHGLYDENHHTTARELAEITRCAMQNDLFRTIAGTRKKIITSENGISRLLINHNKMLRYYPGASGVKTGFTRKSGRCLVSSAERDGLELIAVTLNAPDDWNDHRKMLDAGFAQYERILLTREGDQAFVIPVVGGEKSFINCRNRSECSAVVKRENQNISHINELKRFYYAPIEEGQILGKVIYKNNGEVIAEVPVTADFGIERTVYKNFFEKIYDKILNIFRSGN